MYQKTASAAELDAFGFKPQDYAHEVCYYWPDTAAAFNLFLRVSTQWRTGPNGTVGLDYCAVYPMMDRLGLTEAEWDALFSDLQIMEMQALDILHQKDQ